MSRSLPCDWKVVYPDDVVTGKRSIVSGPFGSNIGQRFFVETGIPVIRGNNLTLGKKRFVDNGFVFLTEEKAKEFKNCQALAGDIVFTAAGTLGQVGIIPQNAKFPVYIISNKQLRLRPDPSIALPEYLYYWFSSENVRNYIIGLNTGSSVPLITLGKLRSVLINLPPLPTQQKIAAILSAYDDLIENNTRRIKILEEMAQAIYREWFVNFRFPGHEYEQMVELELGPVPEGWEVKRLDEVAEVIDCLHGIKPTEVTNDDDKFGILLHVWNIGGEGKLELSKKFFITEEVYRLWTKRIEVKEGDCIITNVGRIGAVAQIPFDLKAAIGRNMTAIRCREGIITPTFLIEYLRSPYFEREKSLKQDSGTIMGSLNVKGIVRLNILIPSFNIVKEFETVVRPFRYRIEIFQKQNDNLRRTRDLLLPKLISGDIDVSKLDIKIHEVEA